MRTVRIKKILLGDCLFDLACLADKYYSFGDCIPYYGDHGDATSCIGGSYNELSSPRILEGICGSGRNRDCDNASHMVSQQQNLA